MSIVVVCRGHLFYVAMGNVFAMFYPAGGEPDFSAAAADWVTTVYSYGLWKWLLVIRVVVQIG
jgi:hypothetical protein